MQYNKMEKTSMYSNVNDQYSFFWDEELPESTFSSGPTTNRQKTIQEPSTSNNQIWSNCDEEQSEVGIETLAKSKTGLQYRNSQQTKGTEEDCSENSQYKRIGTSDRLNNKKITRQRSEKRRSKKAERLQESRQMETFDDDNDVNEEIVNSTQQSTRHCDIDANDDATLWMLIRLSRKMFREKGCPASNCDLRERILIRQTAEKAFNYLFPPIRE
ncbi:hypothetical protein DICVIV_05171 [Dictyocaulus viviparus]|uniref:Uncharacterized protein n=1 Tax=Dictyocaulus viviparus TaxID=29172 RepID=A0A0D8XW53_DICVI|nr:hypothetical protein DICVIV_05171 [Dictyocaulus viviparus]